MGAVHSTSARGELQVLETELAAAKCSAEDVQAQRVLERKAAKESAEAGEARFKAQLGIARLSAAAADTEIAESKKRFQELEKEHEKTKTENRELQSGLSKLLDAHARERADLKKSCQLSQDVLLEKKELVDILKQACQERTVMIQDLTKDLLEARAKLGDALGSSIQSKKEFVVMMNANNKTLAKSNEREKEMVEAIRVLKEVVEEQRGIIEELRQKTKPYWVFDESRY